MGLDNGIGFGLYQSCVERVAVFGMWSRRGKWVGSLVVCLCELESGSFCV